MLNIIMVCHKSVPNLLGMKWPVLYHYNIPTGAIAKEKVVWNLTDG